jgi:S-(hydroxymethyl)glutathione dehydrogenase / alcohol dehydrogenase
VRAAVLNSIDDEKMAIRDDVVAVGPGPGQVRIRVRAAGVCHSDLSARTGALPQPVPAILGHEAAGDVIAVGDGVAGLAVGDRVIANWLPPCGSCPSCLRGEPYLCMAHVIAAYIEPHFLVGDTPTFGMAGCGAFAEEMVVPQEGAVKFASDVPYEVAALVGCGVMTGVGAVINTARVEPGATVAVIGCGGVGISAIQGARLSGATVIVGVDTVASKHEAARTVRRYPRGPPGSAGRAVGRAHRRGRVRLRLRGRGHPADDPRRVGGRAPGRDRRGGRGWAG